MPVIALYSTPSKSFLVELINKTTQNVQFAELTTLLVLNLPFSVILAGVSRSLLLSISSRLNYEVTVPSFGLSVSPVERQITSVELINLIFFS